MQEINELKNLVIQSLEGTGVLSQIRAQLRASVFQIVENQETKKPKKNAGIHWENPLCQSIYDHSEGKLALELINEFLEFFKMDYTLSVFGSESNLKEPLKRDELAKHLGIKGDSNKPVLFQLISGLTNKENQSFNSSTKETISVQGSFANPAPLKTSPSGVQETKKTFDNLGKNKPEVQESKALGDVNKGDIDDIFTRLAGIGKLPPLGGTPTQESQKIEFGGGQQLQRQVQEPSRRVEDVRKQNYMVDISDEKAKKESDLEEYENEMFESVDEELVDEDDGHEEGNQHIYVSGEDVIGASQSQGFDVSVDSLQLEEYDYFENADRMR